MGAHDIAAQIGLVESDLDYFGVVDRDAGSFLVNHDGYVIGVDNFNTRNASVDEECDVLAFVDDD